MQLKRFDDSPDAGNRDCRCSYCGKRIWRRAIRFYDDDRKTEIRFHGKCLVKAIWRDAIIESVGIVDLSKGVLQDGRGDTCCQADGRQD